MYSTDSKAFNLIDIKGERLLYAYDTDTMNIGYIIQNVLIPLYCIIFMSQNMEYFFV